MYMLILSLIVLQLSAPTGASDSGIIGGTIARQHSRPYMVSLQQHNSHVCGGMLIRNDFVLTSGHCLKYHPLLVVLGAQHLSKEEKGQQKIPVADYYRHPLHLKYNEPRYDMMLLKLKKKATLNECVKVIHFPKKNETLVNSQCSVAGWGMTQANSLASDVLREANVTMEKIRTCKRFWQKYFDVKQMLCTRTNDGKGICQGDSGGPLVCNNKAYGVAAYTYLYDCANRQYPNVYMNISFFMPWIEEVLRGVVSPSCSA